MRPKDFAPLLSREELGEVATIRKSEQGVSRLSHPLGGKALEWKKMSQSAERIDENDHTIIRTGDELDDQYRYPVDRIEKCNVKDWEFVLSISKAQELYFIRDIIPKMLERKRTQGEKEYANILDVGGGIGLYAQQIRDNFGPEKVRVYTTGLRKRLAKKVREKRGGRLDKDDLRWRSILQLRDFPEFDLILDTWGEFYYTDDKNKQKYLDAVIKKLLPNGFACIAPIDLDVSAQERVTKFLEIAKESGVISDYKIISFQSSLGKKKALRIFR